MALLGLGAATSSVLGSGMFCIGTTASGRRASPLPIPIVCLSVKLSARCYCSVVCLPEMLQQHFVKTHYDLASDRPSPPTPAKCSTRLSSLPASPWPLLAPSSCAPRAHDPGIVCLGLTGACCPPQDWLPDRRQPWPREHQGIVEPGAQGVWARHDGTPRFFLQPPPLTRVRLACVAVWPFFHVVVYLLDRFLRSTIATRTGTS